MWSLLSSRRAAVSAKLPDTVRPSAPVPASTAPVTVSPCALIKAKPPAPTLVKVPRLVTKLASGRLVPPFELPNNVVPVMMPPVWVIVEVSETMPAWPLAVRLPLSVNAPDFQRQVAGRADRPGFRERRCGSEVELAARGE